jgi:CDP-diacylglycerol---glycerol-3-phosphate 3-phosphatidyltransferase
MNIAMVLTGLRLVLAPLFALTFVKGYCGGPSAAWLWGAFVVTLLSELSDAFDGFFARRQGKVTDFGKVFDPAVDSIARVTGFISFMVCGIIPLWMFLIFMYRDMLMSLLRIVCASKGVVLAARKSGKLKAILQGMAIGVVLILALLQAYGVEGAAGELWGRPYGFWVVLLPAIYTALSMIDYLIPNWGKIVDMARTK